MLRISFEIVKMLSLLPIDRINSKKKFSVGLNLVNTEIFVIYNNVSRKGNDFDCFYNVDEVYCIGKNGKLDSLNASEYEPVGRNSEMIITINSDMLYFICGIKEEISRYEKFGSGIHLYLNDMGTIFYSEIIWPNGKGNENGRKPKGYRFDVSSRQIDKYVFL